MSKAKFIYSDGKGGKEFEDAVETTVSSNFFGSWLIDNKGMHLGQPMAEADAAHLVLEFFNATRRDPAEPKRYLIAILPQRAE